MWRHTYQDTCSLRVERLWPVLVDVSGWAAIDENIDYVSIDGPARLGTRFLLKPKGGPRLRFEIAAFMPPTTYADVCRLPLAVMKTTHRLSPGHATRIEITIEIEGPLAWLWGRTVGRRHAAGLPAQTQRFIAAAMARPPGSTGHVGTPPARSA